jgi:hypothetical protein
MEADIPAAFQDNESARAELRAYAVELHDLQCMFAEDDITKRPDEFAAKKHLYVANNVQLISSAITGRIYKGADDSAAGQAAVLTDVERALVLARDLNAEALLQVVMLEDREKVLTLVAVGSQLRAAERIERNQAGVLLSEKRLRLRARVIDVESGRIVMLVDIAQSTTDAEGIDRDIKLDRKEIKQLSTADDENQALAVEQILNAVAERLRPRSAGEPSARPCQRGELQRLSLHLE